MKDTLVKRWRIGLAVASTLMLSVGSQSSADAAFFAFLLFIPTVWLLVLHVRTLGGSGDTMGRESWTIRFTWLLATWTATYIWLRTIEGGPAPWRISYWSMFRDWDRHFYTTLEAIAVFVFPIGILVSVATIVLNVVALRRARKLTQYEK